ncbi:class I SAM-dependent methyltransferase [Halioxenophilus sp. WMMB6]|uniref:class I SAM-dependent methyltransferase n=1 Tax=Halioxenophilus sp. WMMB6 TaxID=3073815 RepID=UPI00295EFF6D|nr:class I SAM-dependent methyltransferase [Halioxenophilus sp. WMMB6]
MHTIDFQRLELAPNSVILDLGCGEGRHSIAVPGSSDQNLVVGVDLGWKDLLKAQAKAAETQTFCQENRLPVGANPSWINANGLRLPFADDSFDRVICSEVLEHIDDYQGLLTEMHRVLKPGGLLAVSVPRQWPERVCWSFCDEYSQTPGGHIRIFNARRLRRTIINLGFRPIGEHWAHALHTPYWWLKCLLWDKPDHPLLQAYHRLLVWDLMSAPWLTRTLEKILNPLMGKSVVLYFQAEPSN